MKYWKFSILAILLLVLLGCGGNEEKWALYRKSGDKITILKEYPSYEACLKDQKAKQGCRRMDGMFEFINKTMD